MSKIIKNTNPHFEPRIDEHGRIEVPTSTEEHLLIEQALPSSKRRKILQAALDQADLDDPVVFVTAYEALSGYYEIIDDN